MRMQNISQAHAAMHNKTFKPTVSVVLPCLNEEDTLEACILSILEVFKKEGIQGEIVVADNGSTDSSAQIALKMGAKVQNVPLRGYGSAIRGGVEAASSEFIIMADADGSYDFTSIPRFISTLEKGYDLVMGNRFKGKIEHGAMPFSHVIGGTILSMIGKILFRIPVNDFHCGIRAFRKSSFQRMELQTDGMEFASEMIIKAKLKGMHITEIPTILRKDGRIQHPPHLRTFRDGWRHLRYMLLNSRRAMLLYPGSVIGILGLTFALFANKTFLEANLHADMIVLSLIFIGSELIVLSLQANSTPRAPRSLLERIMHLMTRFETGLALGSAVVILGCLFAYFDTQSSYSLFAMAMIVGGLQIMFSCVALNIRSIQDTGKIRG